MKNFFGSSFSLFNVKEFNRFLWSSLAFAFFFFLSPSLGSLMLSLKHLVPDREDTMKDWARVFFSQLEVGRLEVDFEKERGQVSSSPTDDEE